MPHDVFISYSHKDKSATDAICSVLEENNIRCWIAPRDITPGAPFAEAIVDGIKEAKVFVLVYTSNSNNSNQVIKEVDRAVDHRLAIIPFRLEDVPMTKQLEYYVSNVHWLDALTPPLEPHINKLRDVVQILLTLDEVDNADIEEAFRAGTARQAKVVSGVRRFNKLGLLVLAVFTLLIAAFLAIRFFDRQFVPDPVEGVQIAESAHQAGRTEALVKSYGEKSIAVLPFIDMSADRDQEYMSDGIAEELLNLLTKIPELRVISRSSAFSYKGKDIKLAEVARELNVAHILEGSVRKSGNQVRITAQLIEARSDTHLWSETYDRTLDDIFAIQDEIAAQVVEQLKITLLGEAPKVKHTNPEAFALFLQARYLGLQYTAEGFEQSNALYEQALAIDPNYAAAWAGLARNCINQTGSGLRPIHEGYPLAREMLQKALALDPEHAPAHARLGWIAMFYDNDLAAAARHMERALALEPANLDIIGNAAHLLVNLGRLDEGIALQQYVTAQDPVNPAAHRNLGWFQRIAGHWEEAIASNRTLLQLSPDTIDAHYEIGVALLFKGETQAALEEMQLEPSEPYRLAGLAMTHHMLGHTIESDAALEQLIAKYEVEWVFRIATVMAYRNESDRAFERLAKVVEYGSDGLVLVPTDNLFANIHADPRWLPFLHSMGKSPEQLAAVEFRVTLPK